MRGYDGPSFFKEELDVAKTKKRSDKGYSFLSKQETSDTFKPHASQSALWERNRSSTPFHIHTVASSYFHAHQKNPVNTINYEQLKGKLRREDVSFLLFDAHLSQKGKMLLASTGEHTTEET